MIFALTNSILSFTGIEPGMDIIVAGTIPMEDRIEYVNAVVLYACICDNKINLLLI